MAIFLRCAKAKEEPQEAMFGNMKNNLHEFRCPYCNKLLFMFEKITHIQIKCDRCKKIIECLEHDPK